MPGTGELTQPDFGSLCHHGDISDTKRSSGFSSNNSRFDIANVADQPDLANVDLLKPGLNETSARVHIIVRKLRFQLADIQAVRNQPVRINAHLVLSGWASEACHIYYIRHGLELLFDHPVFERLQLHHVISRIRAAEREEVNL